MFFWVNKTEFKFLAIKKLYKKLYKNSLLILKLANKPLFSVLLISEAEAQTLNQKYRQKTYTPDVLSFPLELDSILIDEHNVEYEIGDLFICPSVAQQKAVRYNHTVKQEMAFLFVHGFLHLLGYDHEKSTIHEKEMFALQEKILLSCGIDYQITFDESDYRRHYSGE